MLNKTKKGREREAQMSVVAQDIWLYVVLL